MSRQALAEEEQKTERLLLNILPASIAGRLKAKEHNIADGFPEVTILFADIVGFTTRSQLRPSKRVWKCGSATRPMDLQLESRGSSKQATTRWRALRLAY